MSRPRIEITIDELVLHGFDPRDRHRIADAVQAELETALAGALAGAAPRPGAPPPSIDRLDAGAVRVGHAAPAAEIGARVGAAVTASLAPIVRGGLR